MVGVVERVKQFPRALINRLFGAVDTDNTTGAVDIPNMQASASSTRFTDYFSPFSGSKYPGGLNTPNGADLDYWVLRAYSIELFTRNPYAMGIVNRLVTNVINTGLTLESTPLGSILGLSNEEVTKHADEIESYYGLWAKTPEVCDYHETSTMGQLEQICKRCSLISGDTLVIQRINPKTGLPHIQLIDGISVRTPSLTSKAAEAAIRKGHRIVDGVELDKKNKKVAFYVVTDETVPGSIDTITGQTDLGQEYKRISAFGPKTGRRTAFLVYGLRRRITDVRGLPLLTCIIQSLTELDRYKDAEQRAAVVNSILAMFIKKTEDNTGTSPIMAGAIQRGATEVTQPDGSTKTLNIASMYPGVVMDRLNKGEEPVSFNTSRPSVNFAVFESAIVNVMSWALEIPPSICKLVFSSSWSASKSELNEFNLFLKRDRQNTVDDFNAPILFEWLLSSALNRTIQLPGFIEAHRNGNWQVVASWVCAEWFGVNKPGVDKLDEIKASALACHYGFSNHERESRLLTGTKFSANTIKLKTENEKLIEAWQPLLDAGVMDKPGEMPEAPVDSDSTMPKDKDSTPVGNAGSMKLIAGGAE